MSIFIILGIFQLFLKVTMKSFIPVNLAYIEFVPIDGADESLAPILFLHGLTATKEDWKDIPQIIANRTKRKAYAIDARNHGDSEYTDISNMDIAVDDLFHFMDTVLKTKKAILVGHSMGGTTCIKAALREPKRVEMLFVEDMYTRKSSNEFFSKLSIFLTLFLEGVHAVPKDHHPSEVQRFVIDYICSKLPPDSAFHKEKENLNKSNMQFIKTDDGYDVKFNKDVVRQIIKDPSAFVTEPSGQYNGPAFFVYGGKSTFFVAQEEDHIKKHFPAAVLIEIKEASHNVHAMFPEEFTDVITKRILIAKEDNS